MNCQRTARKPQTPKPNPQRIPKSQSRNTGFVPVFWGAGFGAECDELGVGFSAVHRRAFLQSVTVFVCLTCVQLITRKTPAHVIESVRICDLFWLELFFCLEQESAEEAQK